MAALRNDYAVQTAEASAKRKPRATRGRPALPDDQRRKFGVKVGMTEREYEAFRRWMNEQSLDDESTALRKMFLDRLKSDDQLQ